MTQVQTKLTKYGGRERAGAGKHREYDGQETKTTNCNKFAMYHKSSLPHHWREGK